jgi:DNA-binding HxlR family transcriptional regulator
MIKEMPEWLKKNYNALWGRYRNGKFAFEDVEKEFSISRSMTIKTLWELEKRGFVNKEKNEIDYRARDYRLISPEDIAFVVGLYSLAEEEKMRGQTLMDKFVFIGEKLLYAITGSYAAYHYHHYMNPPEVVEVKVEPQNEGKWIAFLTDEETRVFVGDVIETRKVKNYVRLMHSFRPIKTIGEKTGRGYYIEKPEFLVIELLERQTQTSIMEAIAVIALNESRVAWSGPNGVVNLARDLGISRRLGFLLDAMNFEAKRPMVRQEVLKDVKKDVAGRSSEMFPRDEISFSHYRELRNKLAHQSLLTDKEIDELERAKKRFEGYGELSEKWGIQAILSRDVIRKVLDDLGVELGKE